MATVLDYDAGGKDSATLASPSSGNIPPLGAPVRTRTSWFRCAPSRDADAIATQRSVFDNPVVAGKYSPPAEWENSHRFEPSFRWTWVEERRLVRKMDLYIMVWVCVMFLALELDRANITQALSDDLLGDLGITTNDFNLGNTAFRVSFLLAELPSQLLSKWFRPDRWIPAQITLWSIVAGGQFFFSGRSSFLATRALLGMLQGGFVPDIVIYLSYFYTHAELAFRLALFWTTMSIADVLSALLAAAFFNMRGIGGFSGWRWLLLIEGLLTLIIGILSWLLMPAGPCQTASWFRGSHGWFSEHEEKIIVNRGLREDPSLSSMHNRQPVTLRLLWRSLKDYDLWPVYILGLFYQLPTTPPHPYITLTLRALGFGTLTANMLTIPYTVLHIFTMLGLTYLSERTGQLALTAMLSQIWTLPFLIYMNTVNTATTNRWVIWAVVSLLLGYPNPHPIQVAWTSRNSNAVRTRIVSAACYNMMVQAGTTISSIYRDDDKPEYTRGNRQLLAITCINIVLFGATKAYYVLCNQDRDRKWDSMAEAEKLEYLLATADEGNKRLDFRFHH